MQMTTGGVNPFQSVFLAVARPKLFMAFHHLWFLIFVCLPLMLTYLGVRQFVFIRVHELYRVLKPSFQLALKHRQFGLTSMSNEKTKSKDGLH